MPKGDSAETIHDRLQAVERLTQLFRAERFVYLGFAVIAFMLLAACLITSLFREHSPSLLLANFASSGVVAFTSGRAILMWNRAMGIIAPGSPTDD
jgi:hypothetical protein